MEDADGRDAEALFRAVKLENVEEVARWCAQGGAVNVVDTRTFKKSTPLHWAAYTGNADVVALLIEYGADVNAQESDSKVPLHLAAFEGNYDAVRQLLAAGADHALRDVPGKTPCQVALMNSHYEVAKLFPDCHDYHRGGGVHHRPRSPQHQTTADQPYLPQDAMQMQAPPLSAASDAHHARHDARLVPEVIAVHAGPNAYPVEGAFVLARGEGWERMPVWECQLDNGRIGCIYSGTNGLWIVTEDVCHMESDSGLITSAHKHDGALPHEMAEWETHNGCDWVQDPTVAVEVVDGGRSSRAHTVQQQAPPARSPPRAVREDAAAPEPDARGRAPAGADGPLAAGVAGRIVEEEVNGRASWAGQEARWRRHLAKKFRAGRQDIEEEAMLGGPGLPRRGVQEPARPSPKKDERLDPHAAEATLQEAAKRALLDPAEYEWYVADKERRRAERRAQRRAEREEYKMLRRAERRRERDEYKKQQQTKAPPSTACSGRSRSRSRARSQTRSASAHSYGTYDRYGNELNPNGTRRRRSRSKSRSKYDAPRGRSSDRFPPTRVHSRPDRYDRSDFSTRDSSVPRSTRSSHSRTSRASSRHRSRSRSHSVASSDGGERGARRVWLPPGSAASATGKRVVRDFNDWRTRLAGWDDSRQRFSNSFF